jgi:ATP-binding cassette subfamily B protein
MTGHFAEEEDYRGRFDPRLWMRILGHTRPFAPEIIAMGGAGLLMAALDAVLPYVTGRLIDSAVTQGVGAHLVWFVAAYAIVVAAMCVDVWVFIELAGRIATGVAFDMRRMQFDRLQELSFSYFDTRPVGWLVSRLTSDVSKIANLIPWVALDSVWGTFMLLGISGAMLWINWKLALVVLAIVPPLAVVSVIFQRKMLRSSRQVRKVNSQITAGYSESIAGVRTTKALVREGENLSEFQHLSSDMFRHSVRNALQSAVYLPIVISLGSVGVGLALWRGGVDVSAAGMSLGSLVAFMQYAALFSMPIQELAARFTDLQAAQAAAERIQDLLDTEPEIADSPEVQEKIAAQASAGARDGVAFDGGDQTIRTMEFRNVSFQYKEGEPVLENFNLTVHAGQTVALVGATGGGKSTIVSLAARFYEPTRGTVLLNGVDYCQRSLDWLQSNLGVVLQTPHLFSGTVRENIRYGRLDATDEEVEIAARTVGAHGFVDEMEDGYDAEVGEGGTKLSTGQRQLVSLARAVLADPQIFIMDEATSSVDTETERLIQSAVDAALRGRIAFVIAHRLSTIRSADVIIVIEGGRIAEKGTHQELIRRRGAYHALYTNQLARRQAETAGSTEA